MFDQEMPGMEFFHVGFVVPDIEQAKEMYGAAFGMHWILDATIPQHVMTPEGEIHTSLDACISVEGPPFLELMADPAREVWDGDRYKLNHIGFWAEDAAAARELLERSGFAGVIYDRKHESPLFSFHRSPSGLWIEVTTAATREPLLEQVRLAQERLADGR